MSNTTKSWASIVKCEKQKTKEELEQEEFQRVDALAKKMIQDMNIDWDNIQVHFHPFCKDCGKDADVCANCKKNAVYKNNLCGSCFSWGMNGESMCDGYVRASEEAELIPFKCKDCRLAKPWDWRDDKEIYVYTYEKTCREDPVSPHSVIRVPHYRRKAYLDPGARAEEALEAYNKEMTFSGDKEIAHRIFRSFYTNIQA